MWKPITLSAKVAHVVVGKYEHVVHNFLTFLLEARIYLEDLTLSKRTAIFLSNHQDQNLGNWQLKRQVGSGAPIIFKFPVKFTLKAGQRVTVRNPIT